MEGGKQMNRFGHGRFTHPLPLFLNSDPPDLRGAAFDIPTSFISVPTSYPPPPRGTSCMYTDCQLSMPAWWAFPDTRKGIHSEIWLVGWRVLRLQCFALVIRGKNHEGTYVAISPICCTTNGLATAHTSWLSSQYVTCYSTITVLVYVSILILLG